VAVVTDVYGAREEPVPGVSGKLVVDSMLRIDPHTPVAYLPRLSTVVDYLDGMARPGDLVITLGAGDIHRVGERFLGPA
jgi:UDP-N-acetylmuramate--alanine ligase